jgi:hypothetical protein
VQRRSVIKSGAIARTASARDWVMLETTGTTLAPGVRHRRLDRDTGGRASAFGRDPSGGQIGARKAAPSTRRRPSAQNAIPARVAALA